MTAILILVAIFGVSWLYYSVKEQAKRKVFFSAQYEHQRALTHRNLVLVTKAPMHSVQASLAQHIPDDRSARATFLGGAMRVKVENPNHLVFQHIGRITTGGNGDAFTASITFEPVGTNELRAVVSIDRWREKDGVTRRAGIEAMQNFMNAVVAAFRAVDREVQISN